MKKAKRKTKSPRASSADRQIYRRSDARRPARNQHDPGASLGEKLGVTFQQIQKYEEGAETASAQRACSRSAKALDVSLASMFQHKLKA